MLSNAFVRRRACGCFVLCGFGENGLDVVVTRLPGVRVDDDFSNEAYRDRLDSRNEQHGAEHEQRAVGKRLAVKQAKNGQVGAQGETDCSYRRSYSTENLSGLLVNFIRKNRFIRSSRR